MSMVINNPKEILSFFKSKFFEALSQGKFMDYEEVKKQCYFFLFDEDDVSPLDFSLCQRWFESVGQLSSLKSFIEDEQIREIIVHRPNFIQIDQMGQLKSISHDFFCELEFQQILEVLASRNLIFWNFSNPFQSFFAHIGGHSFRATLIHHCLTPSGFSKLFLRKIKSVNCSLNLFGATAATQNMIIDSVNKKSNILICGKTGSGKTTLLKALMETISDQEHILVLEDTHELKLDRNNFSYLLSDQLNQKKTLSSYMTYAMRMRPDRILLGEMRSSEVIPFLLAMNTGHNGLMATIHANNAKDALKRVALLFSLYSTHQQLTYDLVLNLICSNLDYVIYLEDKSIKEIVKVLGSENDQAYVEHII